MDRDGKPCGLCGGSGLRRLQSMKNTDGSTWELYVPSSLTEEEAQKEYQRSLDVLLNNFKLSN